MGACHSKGESVHLTAATREQVPNFSDVEMAAMQAQRSLEKAWVDMANEALNERNVTRSRGRLRNKERWAASRPRSAGPPTRQQITPLIPYRRTSTADPAILRTQQAYPHPAVLHDKCSIHTPRRDTKEKHTSKKIKRPGKEKVSRSKANPTVSPAASPMDRGRPAKAA